MTEDKRLMSSKERLLGWQMLGKPLLDLIKPSYLQKRLKQNPFSARQQLNNLRQPSLASLTAARSKVDCFSTQKSLVSCIRSVKEMIFRSNQKQKQDRLRREEVKESSQLAKAGNLLCRNQLSQLFLRVQRGNPVMVKRNKLYVYFHQSASSFKNLCLQSIVIQIQFCNFHLQQQPSLQVYQAFNQL